ncbi:MAG TPA: hypothetical protein VM925_09850 [Labilithrix sp.]|jgi:hypothetical protein|nr:hypothetical protein [Labilithrix sp.]
MSKRLLRVAFCAAPLFGAAALGLVSACTEETTPEGSQDASVDVPVIPPGQRDGAVVTDAGASDAAADGSIKDSGIDADAAILKALCETYPNTVVAGDADVGEPSDFTRYMLIALRAIYTGVENAANSCEIGQAFVEDPDPFVPVPFTCLGRQLAALTGCIAQGKAVDYLAAQDDNNDYCVSDAGPSVLLGLHDPATKNYTGNDVDFMIELVKKAALETGMAPADADRLKALLVAEKNKVAFGDAGTGDAGFSQSTCE